MVTRGGASTRRRKGLPVVILNEPAGEVKDLCFGNERSFAAAQDDNPGGYCAYLYDWVSSSMK